MQEIEEIKQIMSNNFFKLCLFIIVVGIVFYVLFYFQIWTVDTIDEIMDNVKTASEFSGFNMKPISLTENSQSKIEKRNNHFIVYGATETGKTTFITKYINENYVKDNTHVFCKDKEEWKDFTNVNTDENLNLLDDMTNFKGTPENRTLIILDDMGNLIKQKALSEIFTKGRHLFIQIIFLGHKPKDVDNKIRENVKIIYATTMNNQLFFNDLNESYGIKIPLSKFSHLEYGIIEIDLIKNIYKVYDKNLSVFYDSNETKRVVTPGFNISKYLNITKFTENEKEEIILFLERESKNTINIMDETFLYYLNRYFIEVLNLNPNFSKLKKLVTDSKNIFTIQDAAETFTERVKSVHPVIASIGEIKQYFS